MKSFIKNHWRILCWIYLLIYLPWFFALERFITLDTPGIFITDLSVDNLIPFNEWFLLPYGFWFIYVVGAGILLYLKGSDKEYGRFVLSIVSGMTLCLIIYMIIPNATLLRPNTTSDSFLGKIMSMLWSVDNSANVCPSIHVYDSLAVHIAVTKTQWFKSKPALKWFSLIACIAICMSTVFLKQHAVMDIVGAIALMCVLYEFIYGFIGKKIFKEK